MSSIAVSNHDDIYICPSCGCGNISHSEPIEGGGLFTCGNCGKVWAGLIHPVCIVIPESPTYNEHTKRVAEIGGLPRLRKMMWEDLSRALRGKRPKHGTFSIFDGDGDLDYSAQWVYELGDDTQVVLLIPGSWYRQETYIMHAGDEIARANIRVYDMPDMFFGRNNL